MDPIKLKSRLEEKVREASPRNTLSPNEALTATHSEYAALCTNAFDLIQENLKHHPMSFQLFDLVKSPAGGATVFSVPGLNGENAEKELTGIILDYTTPRAYWDTPDPVEGTPPICLSQDSILSQDGKSCAHCPYNDFGSKDGESNAKACKESVLLFLLRPDNILPLLIRIPVTSKFRFFKYMTRLVGSMIPLNGVVTKITLEKATSKSGKPYALFNFDAVSMLSHEEAVQAMDYANRFLEVIHTEELMPEVE